MSNDLKLRITNALPIESYISRYVSLKKQGKTWKGLCPFHNEKTPSFVVNPEKNMFYCFGCQKGGDIFRFVMDYESLSFKQALERLAQIANIPLELNPNKKRAYDAKNKYLTLNNKAAQVFHNFLYTSEGNSYMQYLLQRGITAESIKLFQLGASPKDWSFIINQFPNHTMQLLELGLISESKEKKHYYDFFRDRILFPIHNIDGFTVAFGGRVIHQEKTAKYINSKESKIYNKGSNLYGLKQSINAVRTQQRVYLVEGYLDMIGLWQRNIHNVCASLGTALNLQALHHLRNFTQEIIVLFDGDEAGRRAAMSYAKLCTQENLSNAKIVLLMPGKDPFDIAQDKNVSDLQLEDILNKCISFDLFYILETLFPNYFIELAKENKWDQDINSFSQQAYNYYNSKDLSLLPSGLRKRESLNRFYEELKTFKESSTISLYLEEVSKILNLKFLDLSREWDTINSKNLKKKERYSNFDNLAHKKKKNAQAIFASSSSIPLMQDDGPVISKNQLDIHQKYLINLERNILIELIFHIELFTLNYQELKEIDFTDEPSHVLWKYLESQYLRKMLVEPLNLDKFPLSQTILDVFRPLFLKRLENEDNKNEKVNNDSQKGFESDFNRERSESKNILLDYLLQHKYWALKSEISEIRANFIITDPTNKEEFFKKENILTKKLNETKKQLRYSHSIV